jgi:hypothetical protein
LQVRIKMGLSESGKFQRIDCTNARQVDLYRLRMGRRFDGVVCLVFMKRICQDCKILRSDVSIALQVHLALDRTLRGEVSRKNAGYEETS